MWEKCTINITYVMIWNHMWISYQIFLDTFTSEASNVILFCLCVFRFQFDLDECSDGPSYARCCLRPIYWKKYIYLKSLASVWSTANIFIEGCSTPWDIDAQTSNYHCKQQLTVDTQRYTYGLLATWNNSKWVFLGYFKSMMTLSNGIIFRVTGLLCG